MCISQAAVTPTQQTKISKLARRYLQTHNLLDQSCWFDVVANVASSKPTIVKLNYIENVFDLWRQGRQTTAASQTSC